MITTLTTPHQINTTIKLAGSSIVTTTISNSGAVTTLVNIGVKGDAGDVTGANTSSVIMPQIAGETLGGHVVVQASPSGVIRASSSDVASVTSVIGITSAASGAGLTVPVVVSGWLTEPSWSWVPGLPLFVSSSGTLTQTLPAVGYILQMGIALTSNTIKVDLKLPIIL